MATKKTGKKNAKKNPRKKYTKKIIKEKKDATIKQKKTEETPARVIEPTEPKENSTKEDIYIYELRNSLFLGGLWKPVEDFLKSTGLEKKTNPLLYLTALNAVLGRDPSVRLWVAQDVKNPGPIVGFILVTIGTIPIPEVFVNSLWQEKSYANLKVSEKLGKVVFDWARKDPKEGGLGIAEIQCIANKEAMIRGLLPFGFKPSGMLLTKKLK